MSAYHMTAQEMIFTAGSDGGSQPKFFKDGYWFKMNETGHEDYVEELCSKILSCTNIGEDRYVKYERCEVEYEGKVYDACRSKSFVEGSEQYISYEKIHKMMYGTEIEGALIPMESPEERIDYTVRMVKEFAGIDPTEYLSLVINMDLFWLNPDRHMNNLGIIADPVRNTYRNAPIFDNGEALLNDPSRFPPYISLDDIARKVTGRPFSSSLEHQAASLGPSIMIDYERLEKLIYDEPRSRYTDVLSAQAFSYRDWFKPLNISRVPLERPMIENTNSHKNRSWR